MVRLTPLLRFGGKTVEFTKATIGLPGFDAKSLRHNWSLVPLFICTVAGGIIAGRYSYVLDCDTRTVAGVKCLPDKLVNQCVEFVLALRPFSKDGAPMLPKIEKSD